jgi:hypothetical protein
LSAELAAALEITRAVRDGGHIRADGLIIAFVGKPPDIFLADLLKDTVWEDLTDWESGVLPMVCRFLCYHRRCLHSEPGEWYRKRAEYVYRTLKKAPNNDLMRSLRKEEDTRAEQLELLQDELGGTIMMIEAKGSFGRYIGGSAETQSFNDNRLLRDTRKKMEPNWRGGSTDKIVSLGNEDRGLHTECVLRTDASPEDHNT